MEDHPYYESFTHWFYNWVHDEYPYDRIFFDNTFSKLNLEDREHLNSGLDRGYLELYLDSNDDDTCVEYEYDLHGELEEEDDITIIYSPCKIIIDMHLFLYPDDLSDHLKVLYDVGVLVPPHENRIYSTRRISSR